MILKFRPLIVGLLLSSLGITSYSQDLHLSQFDAAPLFYNPALSGNYDGIHRFIGNFKSQWKTYNTGLFSYDKMLPETWGFGGGKFGIGGMVNWDRAGEINYGYTIFRLLPSYHIPIIPNDILYLSAGLDLNFTQNSLASGDVILGYNTDGSPIVGSTFSDRQFYFDISSGINAYSLVEGKYPINLGITLHHLVKQGKSPISNGSIANARRFSINANTITKLNEKFAFLPSLIWSQQKPSDEINVGTYFRYSLPKPPYALYIGSWWRIGDGIIMGAAVDFPGFRENHTVNVGFSFDMTMKQSWKESSKNDRSKVGSNSVEISIKYIIKRAKFVWAPPAKLNPVDF